MNDAAVNICVQLFVETYICVFSVLLGMCIRRSSVAGAYDNTVFSIFNNCQIVFHFMFLPAVDVGATFLQVLTNPCYYLIFFFIIGHPNEYEVMSCCHFDLHFFNG